MITIDRLKELLEYNPDTGEFKWIVIRDGCGLGKIIGTINKDGYHVIRVDYKQYVASRVAWFYMTGEWPENQIDHKDNDPANNKWNNLRKANTTQNNYNRRLGKNNTTGTRGVFKNSSNNYIARIQYKGKKINLGTYPTIEQAADAYRKKAIEIQGEFIHNSVIK